MIENITEVIEQLEATQEMARIISELDTAYENPEDVYSIDPADTVSFRNLGAAAMLALEFISDELGDDFTEEVAHNIVYYNTVFAAAIRNFLMAQQHQEAQTA